MRLINADVLMDRAKKTDGIVVYDHDGHVLVVPAAEFVGDLLTEMPTVRDFEQKTQEVKKPEILLPEPITNAAVKLGEDLGDFINSVIEYLNEKGDEDGSV